jgi:hypothetical protein
MSGIYEIFEKLPGGNLVFVEKAEGLEQAEIAFLLPLHVVATRISGLGSSERTRGSSTSGSPRLNIFWRMASTTGRSAYLPAIKSTNRGIPSTSSSVMSLEVCQLAPVVVPPRLHSQL